MLNDCSFSNQAAGCKSTTGHVLLCAEIWRAASVLAQVTASVVKDFKLVFGNHVQNDAYIPSTLK